jgi:hypothetical protein
MRAVLDEVALLQAPEPIAGSALRRPETTIVVAPRAHREQFEEFYGLVQDVEEELRERELDEEFQVVAFHPLFRFGGEPADDPGNFVNRSPHPALHILRQDAVTEAVESHTNSMDVPTANKQLLRSMGASEMDRRVRAIRDECEAGPAL